MITTMFCDPCGNTGLLLVFNINDRFVSKQQNIKIKIKISIGIKYYNEQ